MPRLRKNYIETGKVRFVYHDFAWIGEESRLAAQAARCAHHQGKYWEYHDHLFNNQRGENQGRFAKGNLKQFASGLGLRSSDFDGCLDAGADIAGIREQVRAANGMGIRSTPHLRLNGKQIAPGPYDQVARAIDAELAARGR